MKKLHLNNGVQDSSRLCELFSSELFRAASVPVARAHPVLLDLDRRKLGLYVAVEAMNRDFLHRHFDDTTGNLFGQKGGGDLTGRLARMSGQGPLSYARLEQVAALLGNTNQPLHLADLERRFDIDQFLSFMALEVILGDTDGYCLARHNYRVYEEPEPGRLTFLPHDLDLSMRGTNARWLSPMVTGLAAQAVARSPELRPRYLERACHLATNLFDPVSLTNQLRRLVDHVKLSLNDYDPTLTREFVNAADSLCLRVGQRRQVLDRELAWWRDGGSVTFHADVATLTNWVRVGQTSPKPSDQLQEESGRTTFHISSRGRASISWRSLVVLPSGRYRFEAEVRFTGVTVTNQIPNQGVGLSVSSWRKQSNPHLLGDSEWRNMSIDFEVKDMEDLDLAIELVSASGEVWFATDSLRLRRLFGGPGDHAL